MAKATSAKGTPEPTGPSVYLVRNVHHHIKIGRSANAHGRVKELQTGSSGRLVVIDFWPTPNPPEMESCLHEALSWCRLEREWFDCLPGEASALAGAYLAGDIGGLDRLAYELSIRAEHAALIKRLGGKYSGAKGLRFKRDAVKEQVDALWPLYEAAHARCVALGLPEDAHRA